MATTDTPTDTRPVAGDTYGEFTLTAYDIPGNNQDYRVVLTRTGTIVREFAYPAYKIWTLLAHWRDNDEVQPNPVTGYPPARIETDWAG